VNLSVAGEPGLKISLFLPADDGASAGRLSQILSPHSSALRKVGTAFRMKRALTF
jgi:hypothetical protein